MPHEREHLSVILAFCKALGLTDIEDGRIFAAVLKTANYEKASEIRNVCCSRDAKHRGAPGQTALPIRRK